MIVEKRYIMLPAKIRSKFDVIDSHTTIPVMVGLSIRTAAALLKELNSDGGLKKSHGISQR